MTNNRTGREISLRIVPPATLVSKIGYAHEWRVGKGADQGKPNLHHGGTENIEKTAKTGKNLTAD
jgi:hypothetical protein